MQIWAVLAFLLTATAAAAEPAKTAVFDLELIDTSVEAGRVREDQARRLGLASAELRELLSK